MKDIPDKSIDMILCDLPYGTTCNKWDSVIPLNTLWEQYERIIKDNGAIVLTAQSPFDKILSCSNLKLFRYEWIWEKTTATGHLNAKKMPLKAHENILVFYKKLPTYNPQKTKGHERKVSTAEHKRNSNLSTNYGDYKQTGYDSTERYPRSVLVYPTDKQKEALHPTQKPVALFEYLIKTYTNEGETVLDNCIGSGTTAISALNTGRFFIGIEREQEYVDIANERIRKAVSADVVRV
jgi:DNA modification methylase